MRVTPKNPRQRVKLNQKFFHRPLQLIIVSLHQQPASNNLSTVSHSSPTNHTWTSHRHTTISSLGLTTKIHTVVISSINSLINNGETTEQDTIHPDWRQEEDESEEEEEVCSWLVTDLNGLNESVHRYCYLCSRRMDRVDKVG